LSVARIQHLIQPVWEVVTDGCKFVDSWKDLDQLSTFKVSYERFQAPMPIAIAKPHIKGYAVKQ
jgi:hypothetical protein